MFGEDGCFQYIPPRHTHRLVEPVSVLEVSWDGDDDDIVRLEDDYDRL